MAHGTRQVLIVEAAGQRLGLPGDMVRELLRAVFITPLPRTARFIEGVISIRGQIVPVLDLRQWLGLPAKPLEPADHLVVIYSDSQTAALRVDRAVELVRLECEKREGEKGRSQVVQHAGSLVVLPDLSLLLAQGKFFLAQEMDPKQEATPA